MELLNKLCDFCATSGNEKQLMDFISQEAKPYADQIFIDNLGNLIVRKNGGNKKVMISTSVDEVGFFTTISNDKEIKVAKIGNIDVKSLSNTLIQFENGNYGVLQGESNDKIENYTVKQLTDDKVDYTGLTATFASNFKFSNDYVISKALSSRIGAYVLLKMIETLKCNLDIYFVFSVKKHIGMKGAKVIGYNINPDLAVVVDCYKGENTPLVLLKDRNYIAEQNISNNLVSSGFKPFVEKDIITEGTVVQTSNSGVLTAVVGLGIDGIFSNCETTKFSEIEKLLSCLNNFLAKEN